MSYKIYITRADHPDQSTQNPIELDEWVNLIKEIPDLHLHETESSPDPDRPSPREGLVRWASHPYGQAVWLSYQNGAIVVENPDGYTAMRMRNLANRLHARVHGW
ncbi:MAG: hypothetical protein ACNA8W_06575 [Bradymonadaceae bacterium]